MPNNKKKKANMKKSQVIMNHDELSSLNSTISSQSPNLSSSAATTTTEVAKESTVASSFHAIQNKQHDDDDDDEMGILVATSSSGSTPTHSSNENQLLSPESQPVVQSHSLPTPKPQQQQQQQQYHQHTPPAAAFQSLPLTKERPPTSRFRAIQKKTVIDPLEGLSSSNSLTSLSQSTSVVTSTAAEAAAAPPTTVETTTTRMTTTAMSTKRSSIGGTDDTPLFEGTSATTYETPTMYNNNSSSNGSNFYGGATATSHNNSSSVISNTNKALFENLNRNFAEKSSTDIGLLGEQACLASFVEIFLSNKNHNNNRTATTTTTTTTTTTEIPVMVVEGLWKNVVLPPLLVESDQYNLKEEDLIPQIWNLLEHELQYLMRSQPQQQSGKATSNKNKNNNAYSFGSSVNSFRRNSSSSSSSSSSSTAMVRVVHGVYVEYGQYLSSYFDVELWKTRFGEYLTRMLLQTGDPLSSSSSGTTTTTMTSPLRTTSFEIVTIQKYATQHILEHLSSSSSSWNTLSDHSNHSHTNHNTNIVAQLLTTPLFLKQIWRFGFPQKNVLQLTKEHLDNISKYYYHHGRNNHHGTVAATTTSATALEENGGESDSYHPRQEHYREKGTGPSRSSSSEVVNAWHALLEQEADGLLLALPIFSSTYNYYSSGDERDSTGSNSGYHGNSGYLSSGNEDTGTVSSGDTGTPSTNATSMAALGSGPMAALSSLTGSHHRRRRRSKQKSNNTNSGNGGGGSTSSGGSGRGGRKRRRLLQKLLKRPTQMLVLGRTLFELGNAHPERRAQLYIQSLEMMVHLLLEGHAKVNNKSDDDDDDDCEGHPNGTAAGGGDGTAASAAGNSTASQKILHRLCALLCAESFMALSQCLAEAEALSSSTKKTTTAAASIARSRSSYSTNSGTSITRINNMAELDNDIELLTAMFAPVFAHDMQQKNDPTNYPGLEDTDNESDDGDSSTQNSAMLSHAFSARDVAKGNRAVHCLKLARRLLKCGSAGTETEERSSLQTTIKKKKMSSKDTEEQDVADTTKTFKLLKENLYAQVNDTMGRLLYDKEQYGTARNILEEAANRKRSVLALLRDDDDDGEEGNDTNNGNSGLDVATASSRDGDNMDGSSHGNSPTPGSPHREPFKRRPSQEDFVTSAKSHSFFTSWRTNNSTGNVSAMSAHQNHPYYSMQHQLQRKICDNLAKQLCLTHRLSLEHQISEMEMSLASTLQYTGLAMHGDYPHNLGALTWLQEALILKTMHLGKMDLEVARLHERMGAVHDDLGQYDTSVSRYRECLRIRMNFLNKSWSSKLFKTILGTLRHMGNAYRMLGDYDNAVGCYWKVALMSRKQWDFMRQQNGGDDQSTTYFCGFGMDSHKGELCPEFRSLPLPHLVLDELRNKGNRNKDNRDRSKNRGSGSSVSSEENHSDDGNNTEEPSLPLRAPPPSPHSQRMRLSQKKPNPKENEMLREAAQAHQTVINLLKDKASKSKRNKKTFGIENGLQNSPLSLANLTADEDIPLLLSASYQLGVIHMFFGEYGSAIARLEHSLRSLWILDPCSSESSSDGSASDGSTVSGSSKTQASKHRRRLMKRIQKRSREIFDKNTEAVDEEGIYHTLGLSRAACNEHDRAIRYLLTALRYARRTHGVDSLRAADILYDAGTSYWYMNEYEKASEFWSACLQIRILHQPDDESSRSTADNAPNELEFAKTLFNVAASHCAMGRYTDPRTTACLEDARKVFLQHSDDEEGYYLEAANCSFYLALVHYFRGLGVGNNPNNLVRIEIEDGVFEEMTAEHARIKLLETATKHLQEAGTIYRSRWYLTTSISSEDKGDVPTGGPILKAHYLYLQGSIVNALEKPQRAIGAYAHACHIYKSNGDTYLVYAASVLYAMGQLYTTLPDDTLALKCFDESLQLRQKQLGRNHGAVGTALFELANIHARLNNYSIGIEMFQEALRIRLLTSGKDSANVAMTLLKMGALHAREGYYADALDRLEGALRIRRDRVKRAKSKKQQQEQAARQAFEESMDNEYAVDMARLAEIQTLMTELVATEEIELGMVVYCMGNVHAMCKEYDTAIKYYEESLELRRKYVANESSLSVAVLEMHVADTLHNLGHVYDERNEYDKALECYREALAIKRCYNVTQHAADEMTKSHSSKSSSMTKAHIESEEQIVFYNGQSQSLLTIEEDEDGSSGGTSSDRLDGLSFDHNGTLSYAATLYRIGTIHYRLKKNKLAINCFETALRIRIRHLGSEHNGVAQTLTDIGNTLRRIDNRQQDALQCYSVALRIRNKHFGPSHTEVGKLFFRMGCLHDSRKDYGQAVSCYRYAVRVYGRKYIHTLGQSMCRALFLQRMSHKSKNTSSSSALSTSVDDEFYNNRGSLEDMMLPSTRIGNSSTTTMEERDKTNRDYYLQVSSALREATKNKTRADEETILVDLDIDSPECWISVELFLLGLLELMHIMAGELDDVKKLSVQKTAKYLETIAADAIVTAEDTVAYNMHYLIQE